MDQIVEPSVHELVKEYVEVRDHLRVQRKVFADYCAKYNARMEQIEGKLLEKLNGLGGDGKQGLKTASGTVFTSTITQPRVVDRDAYLNVVMDNWGTWGQGMLQLREPKVEAIHEYMSENNGKLPDGVEI